MNRVSEMRGFAELTTCKKDVCLKIMTIKVWHRVRRSRQMKLYQQGTRSEFPVNFSETSSLLPLFSAVLIHSGLFVPTIDST